MTKYVVLCKAEENLWEEMGWEEARSATSAIRQWIETADVPSPVRESEYNAVPARSWKPVTVKVETKTALKFS